MSREVLGREEAGPGSDAAAPTPGTVSPTSLDAGGRSWRGPARNGPGASGLDLCAARPSAPADHAPAGHAPAGHAPAGHPPAARAAAPGLDRTDITEPGTDEPGITPDVADVETADPAPEGIPAALRGRRALVVAAVGGALVGGLLATGVAQRADLRQAQSTASVHAWVEPSAGSGSPDAIGLTLRVVNTGDAPVTVVGAAMNGGLDRDGPVRVRLADEVVVRPDALAAGELDAQADCSGTPLAENSSTDGRLQLRVRTQDGREQLLAPPTGGISLTSADVQEAFCGQTGLRLGLSVAAIQVRPGGRLSMSLLNDTPQARTLDFSAPTGTRVVADSELPMVVEPSLRTTLIIGLEVENCTSDAQRVQAGQEVQLVIDGRPHRGALDSSIINAWVAREVAVACS